MSDEQENVGAGSETSGEQAENTQVDSTNDAGETVQTDTAAESAGEAAEQKAGDACTCPDGRPGTLHDQDGTLVCLPNQG
jgi:hypothetical protein